VNYFSLQHKFQQTSRPNLGGDPYNKQKYKHELYGGGIFRIERSEKHRKTLNIHAKINQFLYVFLKLEKIFHAKEIYKNLRSSLDT
jgi:hypothetical protein